VVHYITYELVGIRLPNETQRLEEAIKSFGEAFAFMKNGWFVESETGNEAIAEKLQTVLRPTDRLMVVRIHKDWHAAHIPQAEADWLAGRNFTAVGDPPLFRR